jgi:hypothetical protein
MEKLLKAIIVIGLLVLPWRYYYWPKIESIKADKQMVANYQGSIQRFADGREAMFRSMLEIQKENIGREKHRLEFMLPSFAKARANLMAPFDNLRAAVEGEWHVVPEGKFQVSGPLVFWPFKFTYIGPAVNVSRILALVETSTQFMRIAGFTVETRGELVEFKGTVDLVFHNNGEELPAAGGNL